MDIGQRTSLKNGENENRVCPIAAIAAHWTDNNNNNNNNKIYLLLFAANSTS